MKFKRFSPDAILDAVRDSIRHGPNFRASTGACLYSSEDNHCVIGWLLANEGAISAETWKDLDRHGLVASEALEVSDSDVPREASADELELVDALQHAHDAMGPLDNVGVLDTGLAVNRYCAVFDEHGLSDLSARLLAMFARSEDR